MYCPECGNEVGETDRFCEACGTRLEPERHAEGEDGHERSGQSRHHSQTGWEGSDTDAAGHESRRSGGRQGRSGRSEGLVTFSLGFPSRGGLAPVVIGGVLSFFFWLVIPVFLLVGYFLRLTAAAAAGRQEPPEFENWLDMLTDGVVFVLALLPVLVAVVLLTAVVTEVYVGLYLLVVLPAAYLLPAMFVNFAVEGRVRAMYDVRTLAELVRSEEYLVGFLLSVLFINGVGSVVVVLLMLMTALTVVGILVWPVIYFYWYAISAALWGKVYRQVMGPEAGTSKQPGRRRGVGPRSRESRRY